MICVFTSTPWSGRCGPVVQVADVPSLAVASRPRKSQYTAGQGCARKLGIYISRSPVIGILATSLSRHRHDQRQCVQSPLHEMAVYTGLVLHE